MNIHIYTCVCIPLSCIRAQKNVYATFIQRNLNILWTKFDFGHNRMGQASYPYPPLLIRSGTCTRNFCIWKLISFGVMSNLCMPMCVCLGPVCIGHLLANYFDSCQEHKNKSNSHLLDNKMGFIYFLKYA